MTDTVEPTMCAPPLFDVRRPARPVSLGRQPSLHAATGQGSDWPHVLLEATMPKDGDLVDQLAVWVPDDAVRRRTLVENPERLYGFGRAVPNGQP